MSAPPLPPGGWTPWPAPLPPPRSRALLGVLIGLLAGIIVVSAIGAALLLLRQPDRSVAPSTPGSTLTAAPPTVRTPTPAPLSPAPSTAEPSDPPPTTARPTPTASPSKTAKPPVTGESVLVRNRFYGQRSVSTECAQPRAT